MGTITKIKVASCDPQDLGGGRKKYIIKTEAGETVDSWDALEVGKTYEGTLKQNEPYAPTFRQNKPYAGNRGGGYSAKNIPFEARCLALRCSVDAVLKVEGSITSDNIIGLSQKFESYLKGEGAKSE